MTQQLDSSSYIRLGDESRKYLKSKSGPGVRTEPAPAPPQSVTNDSCQTTGTTGGLAVKRSESTRQQTETPLPTRRGQLITETLPNDSKTDDAYSNNKHRKESHKSGADFSQSKNSATVADGPRYDGLQATDASSGQAYKYLKSKSNGTAAIGDVMSQVEKKSADKYTDTLVRSKSQLLKDEGGRKFLAGLERVEMEKSRKPTAATVGRSGTAVAPSGETRTNRYHNNENRLAKGDSKRKLNDENRRLLDENVSGMLDSVAHQDRPPPIQDQRVPTLFTDEVGHRKFGDEIPVQRKFNADNSKQQASAAQTERSRRKDAKLTVDSSKYTDRRTSVFDGKRARDNDDTATATKDGDWRSSTVAEILGTGPSAKTFIRHQTLHDINVSDARQGAASPDVYYSGRRSSFRQRHKMVNDDGDRAVSGESTRGRRRRSRGNTSRIGPGGGSRRSDQGRG